MAKTLVIQPVTRIEGHAKITIQLNDAGNVDTARVNVIELRGFERFCMGRPVEDHATHLRSLSLVASPGFGQGLRRCLWSRASSGGQEVARALQQHRVHGRAYSALLLPGRR
jgi:hypothetical protein